ncbi:hypothetical protein [Paraliobacillus ryukyuensis]|uniref:hypothetical protein n=1 Tax=Paraliobacillus ryukyuensis TaxID=200904 RepID=UPI0009A6097B|nr:hypothetical protein [Paraliobacillus ryukyuensis]
MGRLEQSMLSITTIQQALHLETQQRLKNAPIVAKETFIECMTINENTRKTVGVLKFMTVSVPIAKKSLT